MDSKSKEKKKSIETDPLKAYSEACNTLRHYSNASLTVRLASIVQGIAILGAWGLALAQGKASLMLGLPIAGLIFTILLYRFHMGYFHATEFFYDFAAKMEEHLFEEERYRPIAEYNRKHEVDYGNIWGKVFTLNAPFTLIGSLFVLALVLTIIVRWKTAT